MFVPPILQAIVEMTKRQITLLQQYRCPKPQDSKDATTDKEDVREERMIRMINDYKWQRSKCRLSFHQCNGSIESIYSSDSSPSDDTSSSPQQQYDRRSSLSNGNQHNVNHHFEPWDEDDK